MKPSTPRDLVPEMAGGCLAARLRVLNRMVTKLYDDALRPHGLRVSQMNILVAVAANGPLRGVDVARFMRLDTSTLSRDLDRMIDRGWVTATAGVGRAQSLEVTAGGRALLAATAPAWRKAQGEAKKLLTPALADGMVSVVNDLFAAEATE